MSETFIFKDLCTVVNQGRGPVRCVKKIRGRRGKPDSIELLVNIDLVCIIFKYARLFFCMFQSVYKLSKEQVSDYKELFILFDKDENGVLSFTELQTAMKTLGQRISGQYQYPFL